MRLTFFKLIILIILFFNPLFTAQQIDTSKSYKDPWNTIVDKEGLEVSFLFYEKGNNIRNGIVIKLNNKNEYAIEYKFLLIFRNKDVSHTEELQGWLNAYEKKTGSSDGLFFLPFEKNVSIAEVGVKKLRVKRRSK